MHMKSIKIVVCIAFIAIMVGCKKQDEWLDERYDKSDVVPETLEDMQGLLDNNLLMNSGYVNLGTIGADHFYVLDADIPTLAPNERNAYQWAKDIFESRPSSDWTSAYTMILYANVVLDALVKIDRTTANQAEFDQVKGSALFFRAMGYYNLAQAFIRPYSATATQDLGLPLKLTSDVNEKVSRATIAQTYERMLSDLQTAAPLLPPLVAKLSRPSAGAANGLLARIYLDMSDFPNAESYATKALGIKDTLVDFNGINTAANFTFSTLIRTHPEIMFYGVSNSYGITLPTQKSIVDSTLFGTYLIGDIRGAAFYRIITTPIRKVFFKGSYAGASMFSGIATNEMYLIKAEAMARNSKVPEAMAVLNKLLKKRFKPANYTELTATTVDEALALILMERRKELPFTAQLRWSDLRRLNQTTAWAKTLVRKINGAELTLPPNDPRYVYPIPVDEIRISGLQQNQR